MQSGVAAKAYRPDQHQKARPKSKDDLDLALLPGESINDNGLFMDSMPLTTLQASAPMEIRLSKTFVDALAEPLVQ